MARWFNIAGPCKPDKHYTLPPTERLPNLERVIDQEGYFVIHAPRQTGKTTAMLALAQQLTASDRYTAVMVSAEVGAPYAQSPLQAETAILRAWQESATFWLPPALHPPVWEDGASIGQALSQWAKKSSRPIVLFIDEVDALQDEALISLLRQLRDGYPRRPLGFPQSIALIGVRDIRDYKVASGGNTRLHTASPFNIKVKSLTLRNFSATEVAQLYGQHTAETGQVFESDAIAHVFHLTQGQPWLVNAIAKETVEELVTNPAEPITLGHIEAAKDILIRRQDTHLDSLVSILREDRVRAVIEPMLAGEELGIVSQDDRQFLIDLGLVNRNPAGGLMPANPIYREVLPRALAGGPQDSLPVISPGWLTIDGRLDPAALLDAFLSFWKQHGEPLLKSSPYHEIAPHLVMMAFLHRVVNGGGTLQREYAIGSRRMDLCLRYGDVTLAMELKVWREGRPDPMDQGLVQLDDYLAGLGLNQGWLVIFDRRQGLTAIADRTNSMVTDTPQGRQVTVIRG
ncbi:ATP-binding protein [Adonisia turfae]|uniref:ATP-binding protein n=1 Tax=Adonisia turfae CCMR0081 TaxID=2292702 RepID=A0A6M0RZ11_9CYAN|nr:ATP-binding protein [Adonisia turfae]NEZ60952.1 ATP-binding protein [Adonisia turfae CCMR0081]